MSARGDIEVVVSRLVTELLPGYVAELHALEAALARRERGLSARWHELRQGRGLEITAAMSQLATFERALAVVERVEHDFETFESGWGQRTPSGKQAAANDR